MATTPSARWFRLLACSTCFSRSLGSDVSHESRTQTVPKCSKDPIPNVMPNEEDAGG